MSDVPRVALLSSAAFAHLDEDLPLLTDALAEAGVDASVTDWHDDAVDWSAFDLVVIRSPWDYTDHLEPFLRRLAQIAAATALANPFDVVRANSDKRYLVRLAAAGVPVIPTAVFGPGEEPSVPVGRPVVVKPTVSVGARDTERYAPEESAAALAHARALLAAGRSVLVQPYIDGVEEHGETGLVYLGDRLSHAFRKGPILASTTGFVEGLYREEAIVPRVASPTEVVVAEEVLDAVGAVAAGWDRTDLLYARVDLVPGPTGPLLMELELIEPSWFLPTDAEAASRAAAVIAARARTGVAPGEPSSLPHC